MPLNSALNAFSLNYAEIVPAIDLLHCDKPHVLMLQPKCKCFLQSIFFVIFSLIKQSLIK